MALANTCGHDRRGNETESDDIKDIAGYIFDEEDKKLKDEIVIKILSKFFDYFKELLEHFVAAADIAVVVE